MSHQTAFRRPREGQRPKRGMRPHNKLLTSQPGVGTVHCDHCSGMFTTEQALQSHCREKHTAGLSMLSRCLECSCEFARRSEAKSHVRLGHGVRTDAKSLVETIGVSQGAGFWACSTWGCGYHTSEVSLLPHESHVAKYSRTIAPQLNGNGAGGQSSLAYVQAQVEPDHIKIPVRGLQGFYELRPIGSTGGQTLQVAIFPPAVQPAGIDPMDAVEAEITQENTE